MNDLQEKIISYIQEKFNPDIIFLGGSRAKGTSRETSDWDLYLIGNYDADNLAAPDEYLGQFLDTALFSNSFIDSGVFELYYGPIYDLVVLKDNSQKQGAKIVENTKQAYLAGPTPYTSETREARIKHLNRLLSKIIGYKDEPHVFTYHLAKFYRDIFPLWFRAHDRWSIPVQYAMGKIKKEDPIFYSWIDILANGNNIEEKIRVCEKVVKYFKEKLL